MAKMGLSVRDDPRKVVDIAGRTWGDPVGGLALSVALKQIEDPDELATVSVAIHNQGVSTRSMMLPAWLHFFHVSVLGADGVSAALTPYGRELLKPERKTADAEVVLEPGAAIEADIPIGSIFSLRKGEYRARATAEVPGVGRLTSNEIRIGR